ncbi:MAG: hypothetical protein IDH49_05870 [Gammaproteobacteria bacterium]|nr:hypothetical protein [Gammaproteobacteria bacterium]
MNLPWTRWSLIMALAGLSACASLAPQDENLSFYPVPAGSRIILHQDLQVPPDSVRAYMQHGQVVKAPSPFDPYCQFEVNDVLPVAQTIKADEFVVRKTQMGEQHIASRSPFMKAGMGVSFGARSGSRDVLLVWYLWLDSPRQPNVRRLICGGKFDAPYRARRPSINEIRAQLGSIATLNVVQKPGAGQ